MGAVDEEEEIVVAWGYRVQRKVDATACCRYWRERKKDERRKELVMELVDGPSRATRISPSTLILVSSRSR